MKSYLKLMLITMKGKKLRERELCSICNLVFGEESQSQQLITCSSNKPHQQKGKKKRKKEKEPLPSDQSRRRRIRRLAGDEAPTERATVADGKPRGNTRFMVHMSAGDLFSALIWPEIL